MTNTPALSLRQTRRIMDAALAQAAELRVRVAIAIVDSGGHPCALFRMDGVTFFGTTLAVNKATAAAGTGSDTQEFAEFLGSSAVLLAAMSTQPNVVFLPGGVPIRIDGVLVGAIGVAGAPGDVEIQIAKAGIAAMTGD